MRAPRPHCLGREVLSVVQGYHVVQPVFAETVCSSLARCWGDALAVVEDAALVGSNAEHGLDLLLVRFAAGIEG